jgi:hypothetical protein
MAILTPLDESGAPSEKIQRRPRRRRRNRNKQIARPNSVSELSKIRQEKQQSTTKRKISPPVTFRKKAIQEGLTDLQKSVNDTYAGTARGLQGMGYAIEPTPQIIKCLNEKIISTDSNAVIILGKNRNGSCLSGYGGLGHTHAAEISLRAGVGGYQAQAGVFANPSNQDAAFVTISQKTDIDENLGFPSGRQPISRTRSAVAAVADSVRLKSREGIKIWAGAGGINSQGGRINDLAYGIDLIHGDGSDMQPIPKGANLTEALAELVERVDSLAGLVDAFLTSQFLFNEAVAIHSHNSPFLGIPTTPSAELLIAGPALFVDQSIRVKGGLLNQKVNLALYRLKYLNPIGEKWICSLRNNTN